MTVLRSIARDLVERRLWPVAALLAVGLVAVPVMFLRPSPGAVEQSAPAPAPAAATAATTATAVPAAATAGASTNPTADPSVALTTSPFSAAFGAPVTLPPAMQSLLKTTEGPDQRSAVAASPLHDPFAGPGGGSTTNTTATTGSTPAASGSTATARTATTPAAPTLPTPTVPGANPAATLAATTTNAAPASTPVITRTTRPATQTMASADNPWIVYRADVAFGTTQTLPRVNDATRLTAFPSSLDPVAIYLGVMRGGWGAVFAIRSDARPIGAPSCRPRRQICGWVILHPGESVTLKTQDPTTGQTVPYRLQLAGIRKIDLNKDAAQAAINRVNASGRCLLGPLAAYHYDSRTGTLAPVPEMQACRYAVTSTGTSTPATTPTAPAGSATPTPLTP